MSLRDVAEQGLAWVDTRRSAVATIAWLERHGVEPRSLVDAGANNSQWMRRLARRWPGAKVVSFEPQSRCRPMGTWHRVGLSDKDGSMVVSGSGTSARLVDLGKSNVPGAEKVPVHRLDRYILEFAEPAVLKVDCEDHTYEALVGAGDALARCACVVAEVWEGIGVPWPERNRHAELHHMMWRHGFDRAMTVGAMPWRNHVSITDALFWRSSAEAKCQEC